MRKPNKAKIKKNHGGDVMTVPGPNLKRFVGYFVLVVMVVFIGGCVTATEDGLVVGTASTYEVTFYDQQTGDTLTNGYVISRRGTTSDFIQFGHDPPDSKSGPVRLHKISEDGTVMLTKGVEWGHMGMEVFVSGHKYVMTPMPPEENPDGWTWERSGDHVKVYLPDVREDYDEMQDLRVNIGQINYEVGNEIFIDGKKMKISKEIKQEINSLITEVKNQYERVRQEYHSQ